VVSTADEKGLEYERLSIGLANCWFFSAHEISMGHGTSLSDLYVNNYFIFGIERKGFKPICGSIFDFSEI